MDLEFPKSGDEIFSDAESNEEAVFWVHRYTPVSSCYHADGFCTAANMILDRPEDDLRHAFGELFGPVVLLYRQSIELNLKSILRSGIEVSLFEKKEVVKILGGHDLERLWHYAKIVIQDCWPHADQSPVDATEAIIKRLHQVDFGGQRWRYQTDKNGKYFPTELLPEFISVKNLRESFSTVCNFLSGCASGIEDGINEMRSNYY